MGVAIGQALPFAVGVALSPIPIIGVVLILGTPRASRNGPAFLAGWIAGLSILGAIVLVISNSTGGDENGGTSGGWSTARLVFGVLLLLYAIRIWHSRPRSGQDAEMPAWMRGIDRFTPARSAAMGVALSALNPKNLLLTAGAAAAISASGLPTSEQIGALAVFVLVASLGPAVAIGIYFGMRDRAAALLGDLKDWMVSNNAAIMATICLLIAAKLIGDGISGLSG